MAMRAWGWVGLGLLGAFFACVNASCSSPARGVRTDAPSFADATHSTSCKIVRGRNEPFIVDWPADRRADLEVLSKERIPVVAYSCDSLEVLNDCEVPGSYKFIGVNEKEESLKLEDSDELRANLPFSGASMGAKLSGEMARGATIDIGYAIIGKKVSTPRTLAKNALKGTCDRATHFVRATTLGAFAMTRGSRGTLGAAADVFAASAKAGSESTQFSQSRDGNLSICRNADSEAAEPLKGCSSPIRLELKSFDTSDDIVSPARANDVEPFVCPTGLVATDDGKCTHPSEKPHLCNQEPADCEIQCTRGSATSCALFARALQVGDGVPKDEARAVHLFDKACREGAMPACGRLGEHLIKQKQTAEGLALLTKSCNAGWFTGCAILADNTPKKSDVIPRLRRACDGGSGEGCWSLGQLYSEGVGVPQSDTEAFKYFALGCDAGAKLGCVSYAKAIDEGKGTTSDPARASQLLNAACDRGLPSACTSVSAMYFTGRGVIKDSDRGVALLQKACDGNDANACFLLGMRYLNGLSVKADRDRAGELFEKGCNAGIEASCQAKLNMSKSK